MGEFVRVIPKTASELQEYLTKLHANRGHVVSAKVDDTTAQIQVDLDWAANKLGNAPDFYIPVKRSKLREAKELVNKLLNDGTHPPGASDSQVLFDLIDMTPR